MNVLITGANGFLGSYLQTYLSQRDFVAIGATRNFKGQRFFSLEGAPEPKLLEDIDAIIHVAHDFRKGFKNINIDGTKRLAEAANKKGIKKQIFISSYSAQIDAPSEYGQTKYELEKYFNKIGAISIRPGLVIGEGGIFLKIVNLIKKFPIVPIPVTKSSEVPLISILDLSIVIEKILKTERPFKKSIYNIFYREFGELKSFSKEIAKLFCKKRIFIKIPVEILIYPFYLFNKAGLKLPIDVDNLSAFAKNQNSIFMSDLELFDIENKKTEEIMKEVFLQK